MPMILNVGRTDRGLRVLLGTGLAIAGAFVHTHRYLGGILVLAGVSFILSGICGK